MNWEKALADLRNKRICPLCNEICQLRETGSGWSEVGNHLQRKKSSGHGGRTPYPACSQTGSVIEPSAKDVQKASLQQVTRRRRIERARDKSMKIRR